MTTTYDRLCAILVRDHKLPMNRLTLDARLDSLGIDSLGTVELLWNVEDAFRIKLPTEPAELSTVGDVVRYIEELVVAQGGAVPNAAAVPPSLQTS